MKLERNLEQTRGGGEDSTSLPSWSLEVKRYAKITQGLMEKFWAQTKSQAAISGRKPALAFREDHGKWRVMVRISDVCPAFSEAEEWPLELQPTFYLSGFAALVREHMEVKL